MCTTTQSRISHSPGAHGTIARSYAGCKTPVPKRPNAVMEMYIATVQKEIGELQHKVDEKEAIRNVGNGPQEREETIRIESVASTCRSVLGMVALRGLLALSAPWDLDG